MNEKQIFALGFFDGVHLGHQALLRACVNLARETGAAAGAITFQQHPKTLLSSSAPRTINTLEDRVRLLEKYGIRRVYPLPVTPEVMSTPWEDFLQDLLARGAAGFVCGDDFRFGSRGLGTAETLREFCRDRGLPCVIVPEQTRGSTRISSTRIRELLEAGEMEEAVALLGHPHILSGKVVHGQGLGHTMGIPTANLRIPYGVVTPRYGVYAARCRVDGRSYAAVTNIGVRPTVSGTGVTVEPWILNFQESLYDREITLEFYAFLRPEQRFSGLAALQAQIRQDGARAVRLLAELEAYKDS